MIKCGACKLWFSEMNAKGCYVERALKPFKKNSDLTQSWKGVCPHCNKKISVYSGRIKYMYNENDRSNMIRLKQLRERMEGLE